MPIKPLGHVLLLLLLALLFTPLQAAEGQQRLEAFLKDLSSMEAGFVQTLHDARGELVEQSHGRLWLSRPGRFRLHYVNPYDQLYVADGQRVWMYDRDLEQVTVRPQTEALSGAPALLMTAGDPLEENFSIEELGLHEGFYWLELTPRDRDSNFDFVRLAIEDRTLRAMEMVDGFGQTTRLLFETVERNPALSEEAFRFTPPPGVDVIGER
ncbi:MAG: outer membrane lipoprotein chaperone LolA [Chromatiales bacterium]|nr:outer membrane lipoprotein chaperone LolA [Gammaproteobacteria bacterium]MBW6475845.1 outer membrane lipoprotein chaperone LolA [Chromatiales bacterium]